MTAWDMTTTTQFLVCAPLRVEACALRAGGLPRHVVRRTGYGPRRSARSAAALAASGVGTIAVGGLAGGLAEEVRSGDVVVATELRGARGTLTCTPTPWLARQLRGVGLTVHCGPIVTTDHVVHGAERVALARSGALAVDMESAHLAAAFDPAELIVVRTVVDTASEPILDLGTPRRVLRALFRLSRVGRSLAQWRRSADWCPATQETHQPGTSKEVS